MDLLAIRCYKPFFVIIERKGFALMLMLAGIEGRIWSCSSAIYRSSIAVSMFNYLWEHMCRYAHEWT